MSTSKAETDSDTVVSMTSKAEADSNTVVSMSSKAETDPAAQILAKKARKIRAGERFEPMPQSDVLLCSPHRNYLTKANHAYIELDPSRSIQLNVEKEVRDPLRKLLQRDLGRPAPEPIFWIGTDKVRSNDDWKPGTMKTFAVGKRKRMCYTVVEASDRCIIEEHHRNGKGKKRKGKRKKKRRDTKDANGQQENNEALSDKTSAPRDFAAETEATVLPLASNGNSLTEADQFSMDDQSSNRNQQHFAAAQPSNGVSTAPSDPSDNRQYDYEPLDETMEDYVEIQTEEMQFEHSLDETMEDFVEIQTGEMQFERPLDETMEDCVEIQTGEMQFEPLDAKMSSGCVDEGDAVASTVFDVEPAELAETNDFEPYPLQYQDRASLPTGQSVERESLLPCFDNVGLPQRGGLRSDAAFGRQFHHLEGESSLYSGVLGGLSIQSYTSELSAMSDPGPELGCWHNEMQTKRFSTQSDYTDDRTQNPMRSMFSGFGRSMHRLRQQFRANTDDDDTKTRGGSSRTGSIH